MVAGTLTAILACSVLCRDAPTVAEWIDSGPNAGGMTRCELIAAAVVDGVRLAELTESLPVSRGSVFELVKAPGILTAKGPGADGRGRVAWVSGDDVDRLAEAAQRVARGEVRITDLAGGLVSQRTPQTAQTAHAAG